MAAAPPRLAFVKRRYVASGGGERYLELLLRRCADAGFEIHVLTTDWPAGADCPWHVHALPLRAATAAGRLRAFSAAAASRAEAGRFDAVFSLERTERQDLWRAGEGVHRVWLERRRAFEPAWRVGLLSRTPRQRALLELEARAALRTPVTIANSDVVRRDLERVYGGRVRRIAVIRNGVDEARFALGGRAASRARLRGGPAPAAGRPLVLFAGSGFRRKGLDELLRALARLPGVELVVLGRDAPGPWRRRAGRLGVGGRVRFPGPTPDLAAWYHAADAVALPTWFDSFSNVGLEAMRCGTPLVTTRFAGVHELVRPGTNGAVVERPDDIDALAAALRGELARAAEPGRAEAIAASVAGCTMEENARATLALLEEAVAARRAAGGAAP